MLGVFFIFYYFFFKCTGFREEPLNGAYQSFLDRRPSYQLLLLPQTIVLYSCTPPKHSLITRSTSLLVQCISHHAKVVTTTRLPITRSRMKMENTTIVRDRLRLCVHRWIRGHVLRERSNVIRGGRSGAVPLWSEISKLFYTSLNIANQIAQRAFQCEGSQFFVQLDEKISMLIRHQCVRLVPQIVTTE